MLLPRPEFLCHLTKKTSKGTYLYQSVRVKADNMQDAHNYCVNFVKDQGLELIRCTIKPANEQDHSVTIEKKAEPEVNYFPAKYFSPTRARPEVKPMTEAMK